MGAQPLRHFHRIGPCVVHAVGDEDDDAVAGRWKHLGREFEGIADSRRAVGQRDASSAAAIDWWSALNGATTPAAPAKEMMPILVPAGLSSMNARAALFAACARVGKTSAEAIDPEVSMHMKTEPSRTGSSIVTCGPDTPKTTPASAASQRTCSPRGIHCRGLAASTKNATFE